MQRRYHPHKYQKKTKRFWVNEGIRIPHLRVIGQNGENLGVMERSKALLLAREAELDLVVVNPKTEPPVAKILDWGQFKYEREKQERKMKTGQKKFELKGVRLTFRIKGHDLENRKRQTQQFLAAGYKVRIELILKGREKAHKDIAREMINNFVADLVDQVKIIQPLTEQGSTFSVTIAK